MSISPFFFLFLLSSFLSGTISALHSFSMYFPSMILLFGGSILFWYRSRKNNKQTLVKISMGLIVFLCSNRYAHLYKTYHDTMQQQIRESSVIFGRVVQEKSPQWYLIKTGNHIGNHYFFYLKTKKALTKGALIKITTPYWLPKHTSLCVTPALAISNKITQYQNTLLSKLFEKIFQENRKKNTIIALAKESLHPTTFSLFTTIFLGGALSKNHPQNILFQRWGILHYLARSGMHVALIASLVASCATPLVLFARFNAIIVSFFLLLLLLFSCCTIPFYRATITYILTKIATNAHIFSLSFFVNGIVAMLFLLYDPTLIFHLSFQLSFITTGLITLWYTKKI